MNNALKSRLEQYPFQFWLLFGGMFISTLGMSMIWPFLMIYVKGKLAVPMTQVASLMTVNAAAALVFSFVSGPIIDRLGRKWTMVFSLAANGVAYLMLGWANSLMGFVVLMAVRGAISPMYQIGADAMLADLIPAERRVDGYALTRMSKNAAIALGPAIGGFIAAASYSTSFFIAFLGLIFSALLLGFLAYETRPEEDSVIVAGPAPRERFAGYGKVLRDRPFIGMVGGFTLATICATLVWVLLGVYVTENFGLTESQYGFIPMTNALMVVFLQVAVTNLSKRKSPQQVMAAGSLLYALGGASMGFAYNFWGFWLGMVALSFGELLLVPTATTFAANLAPADMRGRYMSLHSLSWQLAAGVGPLIGGLLNDLVSPQSTWLGGGVIGLGAAGYFLWAGLRQRRGGFQPAG